MRRNAVATDRNGSEIRLDDTVREFTGERKQGVIKHIYRSFLFLHNREQVEDSGMFVARASNVQTVAAKGARTAGLANGTGGIDLSRMNPAAQRNGPGTNGNAAMPPPKSFGRDKALGQTVTIRKGPYKGLLGIVKDTTDTEARVELHTKNKTITVGKDTLGFKDSITGRSIDYMSFAGRGGGAAGRGGAGASRGGYGGATPARPEWSSGGRTPQGPSMGNGGRTPAWNANSSRTPAWNGGGGGGMSGRTPAWSGGGGGGGSGGRTPAWGGSGHMTVNPYDGSRTAYGGAGAGGVSLLLPHQSSSPSTIRITIITLTLPSSAPQPGIPATELPMAALAPPLLAHQTTTTHSRLLAPKPHTVLTLALAPTALRWATAVSVALLPRLARPLATTARRHQLRPLLPSSRLMLVMLRHLIAGSRRRHIVDNLRRRILDSQRRLIAGNLRRRGGEGIGMMGLGMRKGRPAHRNRKVVKCIMVGRLWVCFFWSEYCLQMYLKNLVQRMHSIVERSSN